MRCFYCTPASYFRALLGPSPDFDESLVGQTYHCSSFGWDNLFHRGWYGALFWVQEENDVDNAQMAFFVFVFGFCAAQSQGHFSSSYCPASKSLEEKEAARVHSQDS